jgi:hypothetical protein
MRTGETVRLSREEARVLGERFAHEAVDDLALSTEQERELAGLFERILSRAFEAVHADGSDSTTVRLSIDVEEVLAESRGFLAEKQVEGLRTHLLQRLGVGPQSP